MSELFPDLYPLARGMDVTAFRHKVLAGNLANSGAPDYVRKDVIFEELLKDSLGSKASPESFRETLRALQPKIVEDATGEFSPDGNNVTIERENSLIGRNEILHNLYAEILSLKIGQIKHAIGSR